MLSCAISPICDILVSSKSIAIFPASMFRGIILFLGVVGMAKKSKGMSMSHALVGVFVGGFLLNTPLTYFFMQFLSLSVICPEMVPIVRQNDLVFLTWKYDFLSVLDTWSRNLSVLVRVNLVTDKLLSKQYLVHCLVMVFIPWTVAGRHEFSAMCLVMSFRILWVDNTRRTSVLKQVEGFLLGAFSLHPKVALRCSIALKL